jgi:nucleotide-binding universal stress UspA family protein
MAFHVILARLNGSPSDGAVLNGALSLSRAANAHICALFCRPDPRIVTAAAYDGVYAGYYDDLVASIEREWTSLANRALAKYEAWKTKNHLGHAPQPDGGQEPSSEWREVKGNEAEIVRRQGRLSDITVIALPTRRADEPYDTGFEAALLDTGRPILLVPRNTPVDVKGRTVVVAWNGSAEAARAVNAAMPLLHEAGQVLVFTAAEARVERAMADELAAYLRWHRIAASVVDHGGEAGISVEDNLRRVAHKAGASLLVMGAYTHSRWRELIFGGLTRHMFDHAEMPVLMAH